MLRAEQSTLSIYIASDCGLESVCHGQLTNANILTFIVVRAQRTHTLGEHFYSLVILREHTAFLFSWPVLFSPYNNIVLITLCATKIITNGLTSPHDQMMNTESETKGVRARLKHECCCYWWFLILFFSFLCFLRSPFIWFAYFIWVWKRFRFVHVYVLVHRLNFISIRKKSSVYEIILVVGDAKVKHSNVVVTKN